MAATGGVRSKKVEQGEATRAALVEAARTLFAEKGFAATATEEIVERAQVTRGALYHHFSGKDDLFRAVYEDCEQHLCERLIAAARRGNDPIEQLALGFDAFLEACLDPAVQRIALIEAPTVLGWLAWREIDAKYGYGLIAGGVKAAIDAGQIRSQPVEPLANILLGALMQAGLFVAEAPRPRKARAATSDSLRALLDGLRIS